VPSVGDIYFLDPEDRGVPHFWIIIAEVTSGECYIAVNATSHGRDFTCQLDHHDSAVFTKVCHIRYERARYVRHTDNWPSSAKRGRMRSASLERVQAGAHASQWTPIELLPYIPGAQAVPSPTQHRPSRKI
jgi:hypothetical protein